MLHRNSRVNLYTYLSNLSEKRLLNKDSKTFLRILKWPLKWPWQYSKLYISILLGWKSCQDCNQLMQTMCFFAFFACLDWTENNFVNWKNKLILLIFQSVSGLGFWIRNDIFENPGGGFTSIFFFLIENEQCVGSAVNKYGKPNHLINKHKNLNQK